jgi:hypothetical protein
MNEWVSAAIGAGSAILGGLMTGWFTRSAGHRQAAAAAHAGNRQADALISTVRETLDEQRAQAHWEARRNVYAQFLDSVGDKASRGAISGPSETTETVRAFLLLELEGPEPVIQSGAAFSQAAGWERRQSPGGARALSVARNEFVRAARAALAR